MIEITINDLISISKALYIIVNDKHFFCKTYINYILNNYFIFLYSFYQHTIVSSIGFKDLSSSLK